MQKEKIMLEKADIHNKTARIPLCIAIEMSEKTLGSYQYVVKGILDSIISYLKTTDVLYAVDMAVLLFGDRVIVSKGFEEELKAVRIEQVGGQPNLNLVLKEIIKRLRIRKRQYSLLDVKYYSPNIIIIGSGNSSEQMESKLVDQIRNWDSTRRAAVLPILAEGGTDRNYVQLTENGEIYEVNESNFAKMFESFGKSMEQLSKSSSEAASNLKANLVSWDNYKRK